MINQASLQAVASAQINEQFVRPLYESYSFARIPATIRSLLTGESGPNQGLPVDTLGQLAGDYDAVVLFFIDAFGWRFFERFFDQSPFLQQIGKEGVISQLTSQFPSTTAAHVTTIHTGQPVGRSGVYEWFYYEPQVDAIIAPLLYSYAGDRGRNTLRNTGISPRDLYPTRNFYQDLAQAGIRSCLFQHRDYAFSPFTQVVGDGADIRAYSTVPEALVNLADALVNDRDRCYYFIYVDSVDAIGHKYGPDSPQFDAELDIFLNMMDRIFSARVKSSQRRILCLMTADHGQTRIDPATTFYLNHEIPALARLFRTNRDGQPLVPAGSPRDMFLYIQPPRLEEAEALLWERLVGKAEVRRTSDLLAEGYFGEVSPSSPLLGRLGNLVILPYANDSVWWYEQGRFEQSLYGMHGGLHANEMQTILLAWRP